MNISFSEVKISFSNDEIKPLKDCLLKSKQACEKALSSETDEQLKKKLQNTINGIDKMIEQIDSSELNLDRETIQKIIDNLLQNLDFNTLFTTILIKYAEKTGTK